MSGIILSHVLNSLRTKKPNLDLMFFLAVLNGSSVDYSWIKLFLFLRLSHEIFFIASDDIKISPIQIILIYTMSG